MRDPYQVLGITPYATDDEVKSAYRKMAKKYHPDNFAGSDLAAKAEQKMKEVNAAYQEIQDIRAGKKSGGFGAGGYGGNYGSAGNGGSGSSGSDAGSSSYRMRNDPWYICMRARELINQGRITEAEELLDRVPESKRDAQWHFCRGHVCYRKGYMTAARAEFKIACDMDPTNPSYRNAYDSLDRGSQSSPYGNAYSGNGGGCLTSLACLNCLCACMRCC